MAGSAASLHSAETFALGEPAPAGLLRFQYVLLRRQPAEALPEPCGLVVIVGLDGIVRVKDILDGGKVILNNQRLLNLRDNLGRPLQQLRERVLCVGDTLKVVNGSREAVEICRELALSATCHMQVERPSPGPAEAPLAAAMEEALSARLAPALPPTLAPALAAPVPAPMAVAASAPADVAAPASASSLAAAVPADLTGAASPTVPRPLPNDGGKFRAAVPYNGVETQAGYLALEVGDAVHTWAGSEAPGEPESRYGRYVYGFREDRQSEGGWFPTEVLATEG